MNAGSTPSIGQAKESARRWVEQHAPEIPGLRGALVHGSANWLADDAPFPATSDLDVLLIVDADTPGIPRDKVVYEDVELDISALEHSAIEPPERVLSAHHLAGTFYGGNILYDPSGELAALHALSRREYRKASWVRQRCAAARDRVLRNLDGIDSMPDWHDQAMAWLFATGVTTHILLVAGLANPTVRRRYVAVRELLHSYGLEDAHEMLLGLLGCAQLSAEAVRGHLAALTAAYDAALLAPPAPWPFAADISAKGRTTAIDDSAAMIDAGLHREAVFWLAVTYTRCLKILAYDGHAERAAAYEPGYRALLADLGVHGTADLVRSGEAVRAALPEIWRAAEQIMAANPEIIHDKSSGDAR